MYRGSSKIKQSVLFYRLYSLNKACVCRPVSLNLNESLGVRAGWLQGVRPVKFSVASRAAAACESS